MPTTAPASHRPHPSPSCRGTKTALVVGAGPGGLAAALLLARAGVQVHVVERLPRVGGRCSAIEKDGFRFDLGPTFFLYPTVLERIFRLIGRDLKTEVPMTRLDPQYRLVYGGNRGALDCTPDLARMEREVATLAPADAANVRRFIADNRDKLDRFRPILENAFSGWRDLFRVSLLRSMPVLRPWNSVDAELRRYFADDRVRLAFTFQSKYLGMSPFNCPSLFSILSYLEYDYGVWHPTGGCSAVSEAMARIAREMGVTFSLGEEVTGLLYDGKKAVGIKTATGEQRADAVVLNADFARFMTKNVPNTRRRRWADEKLATKRFSCSTFMLYLGIDGRYEDVPHHTIYTAEKYEQNLADIEGGKLTEDDPSVYVQNACVTDPSLAPKGMSTLYVLAPVSNLRPGDDWSKWAAGFRRTVLAQLPKLGIKDVENRMRFEKIVTPNDWQDRYEVHRGATFNLAHNLGQMLHLRPKNRFDDVPGVYLVGGGTHPGSWLPVIYESARITTRLLLRDLNVPADYLENEMTNAPPMPHQ